MPPARCFFPTLLAVSLAVLLGPEARAYELAYYRFEEGKLADIIDWVWGEVGGTHNASYSEDVPHDRVPANCNPNHFSLEFQGGASATFTSTFVFHEGAAYDPATLEFWIKAPAQEEASIFWTETAGEDRNRFNIYLRSSAIGGEYRDAAGELHPISAKSRTLPAGRWTHVAVVRSEVWEGEQWSYRYEWTFDGSLDEGMTALDPAPSLPAGSGWTIGGRPGSPFTGLIDEVRFMDFEGYDVSWADFLNAGAEDCNSNGLLDRCELSDGVSQDCDGNVVPDECDLASGAAQDCNQNGVPDSCDLAQGTSEDCDASGIPDECEPDCNQNGVADLCDLTRGTSRDCNRNGIPEECDLASGASPDCNGNLIPDACELIPSGFGYGEPSSVPAGDRPSALVAADLDGDGRLDLATANRRSDDVAVLLGQGDGSFAEARLYPAGDYPYTLLVADLNGDGHLDLATTNRLSDDVTVLRGLGAGTFAEGERYPTGDYPEPLVAADLNGDGRLDLAAANRRSDDVAVLLGQGGGTFADPLLFPAGDDPASLIAAHLDGDGALDLATANRLSNDVSVLMGQGDGSFSPARRFAVGSAPVDLLAFDSGGDGVLDLATANTTSGEVALLLGNGDGTFAAVRLYPTGPGCRDLVALDANGDGFQDLAAASTGGSAGTVSVLLADGAGGFGAPGTYAVEGPPVTLIVADLDGDGLSDLATVSFTNRVSVLVGLAGDAFREARSFATGSAPQALAALDLDGDGLLDLVTPNALSDDVSVLLNAAAPPLSPDCNGNSIPDGCDVESGASQDANQDGLPDECGLPFRRGDCDGDLRYTVTDGVVSLRHCFRGQEVPCRAACDSDGDGSPCRGVTDGVFILTFIFRGGASPPPPFPGCGPSDRPADLALGCLESPCP